ncbi:MAG: ABC transporter ATP-binding protein [Lachnospiraceae bacterium]|nr:ABC transporter ATP-binding protein [Lachnospiraceae bacterium]
MEKFQWIGSAVSYVLVAVGYWKIFGKCGVKRFWAFIPTCREYQVSRCADREKEGRTYAIISAFYYLAQVLQLVFRQETIYHDITVLVFFTLAVARLIYLIRIYLGLIRIFERRRRWIWLFIIFEGLTAIIWGFSPKFQPSKKVPDPKAAKAARLAGVDAGVLEDGLTINIKARTVIDFFRKRYLLRDIHMNIPKGHMVLLLGGSGAGKTTFVNAVTGYEQADAQIMLDGRDIYREYDSMKYDVGFVPQQDLMRGSDTVKLTLSDAATLRLPYSVSASEKRKRVSKVLEQFGLSAVRHSLVEKLSGGQRKRLSIAMEFISDPTLFILDEPDSGLDGVVARSLFEKLRSIADEGRIVVVITHTPDRVIDLFDDVIVLAKDATRTGRLAWYGAVNEAYDFFGKKSMEEVLLSINQKEEGGEGRANEFVDKYAERMQQKAG